MAIEAQGREIAEVTADEHRLFAAGRSRCSIDVVTAYGREMFEMQAELLTAYRGATPLAWAPSADRVSAEIDGEWDRMPSRARP